jgi:NADH:ubiquinone oxidoreductase subunit D
MFEMGESLNISNQAASKLLKLSTSNNYSYNVVKCQTETTNNYTKKIKISRNSYVYMEDLIEHFVSWHTGLTIKNAYSSIMIESPKGEFGVSLVSNNTSNPFKCKIRSPSYHNLQFLPKLMKGHLLGDLATLIGTIDIVFGEIDR